MYIDLKSQYEFSGIKDYKIDSVFNPGETVKLTLSQSVGAQDTLMSDMTRKKA